MRFVVAALSFWTHSPLIEICVWSLFMEMSAGSGHRSASAAGPDGRRVRLFARLARQLLELVREIKDLGKQLAGRFGEHPDAGPITSLDGVRLDPGRSAARRDLCRSGAGAP